MISQSSGVSGSVATDVARGRSWTKPISTYPSVKIEHRQKWWRTHEVILLESQAQSVLRVDFNSL